MYGHFILDPCFSASPSGRIVVCPERPWSMRVVLMRLTQPLPQWHDYKMRYDAPWGIWTTTGKRCFVLSHFQEEVAGRPRTYNCVGGGVLAGFVNRSRPTWTISFAPSSRSERLTKVGITGAWR